MTKLSLHARMLAAVFWACAVLCAAAIAFAPLFSNGGIALADEEAPAAQQALDEQADADGQTASADAEAQAPAPGATSIDSSDENYVDPAQTADNSFIYDTTIASLAQEASFHNGQIVQVLGEVVGDRLSADQQGHYWITIEAIETNDSSTISAYVTASQAEKIDSYGRYGVTGTHVQARGEYHQACNEHDGLADIHVTSFEVVQPGSEAPDQFVLREFLPGAVLLIVGIALVVLFRIVRERSR